MPQRSPIRYFKTSPEIIRPAVMLYSRFQLSLRKVEGLLHERGPEISHETVRFWWNRFGPMLAGEIPQTTGRGRAGAPLVTAIGRGFRGNQNQGLLSLTGSDHG